MTEPTTPNGRLVVLLRILLAAAVIVVPLWYAPGAFDLYRLPKLLLFRGVGIALAAVWLAGFLVVPERTPRPQLSKRDWILIGCIAIWAAITTLLSTDRLLSAESLLTAGASLVVFLVAAAVLRGQPLRWTMLVIAAPALVNVAVVVWQAMHGKPAITGEPSPWVRVGFHGLLGNANDMASFFAIPAMALVVFATVTRGWTRVLAIGAFLAVIGAVVLTNTLATMLACALGLAALATVTMRGRTLIIAGAATAILFILAAAFYAPLRSRVTTIRERFGAGDFDAVMSGRLVAFATTVEMIRTHPWTGVGPGCFELQYMGHQQAALARHPRLKSSTSRGVNFGEAHNELLQYAAEEGIPGGLLYLAVLGALFLRVRSANAFASRLAVALIITVFVSALAQFPFRLASPTLMFFYVAALCVAEPS